MSSNTETDKKEQLQQSEKIKVTRELLAALIPIVVSSINYFLSDGFLDDERLNLTQSALVVLASITIGLAVWWVDLVNRTQFDKHDRSEQLHVAQSVVLGILSQPLVFGVSVTASQLFAFFSTSATARNEIGIDPALLSWLSSYISLLMTVPFFRRKTALLLGEVLRGLNSLLVQRITRHVKDSFLGLSKNSGD